MKPVSLSRLRFVGKTMEFKVVKINQEFKNVVVSHKALIEAELEQQKKEIIGLTSIWEPGKNASIPNTSTIIPPLVRHLM